MAFLAIVFYYSKLSFTYNDLSPFYFDLYDDSES